jgi:hypothetical protein
MSKEAMKLALEAFKKILIAHPEYTFTIKPVIKALEEALAKQEQGEPVTDRFELYHHIVLKLAEAGCKLSEQQKMVLCNLKAVTTPQQSVIDKSAAIRIATALGWTPPRQEQSEPVAKDDADIYAFWARNKESEKRKPLTDARLDDIYYCVESGATPLETWREQARAIEAAHGIKE